MRGLSKDVKIKEEKFIVDPKGDIDDIIAKATTLTKKFETTIQSELPDRSTIEEFEGLK